MKHRDRFKQNIFPIEKKINPVNFESLKFNTQPATGVENISANLVMVNKNLEIGYAHIAP